MKIAVNAQFLNKPGTGTGQYFIRLLEALLEVDKENTYVLYSEASTPPRPSLPRLRVRIVNTPFYTRDDLIRKTIWEKFVFPKAVKKDKADLAWSPYFSVSRFRDIPHVMTIHDVIYQIFPQYVPNIRWRTYYKLAQKAARQFCSLISSCLVFELRNGLSCCLKFWFDGFVHVWLKIYKFCINFCNVIIYK